LFQITGQPIAIFCAGRTDAGVHAFEQVAHLDLESLNIKKIVGRNFLENDWEKTLSFILRYKLNCLLPDDIVIKKICLVNLDFDARRSAISRTYKYYISNNIAERQASYSRYCLWVNEELKIDFMNESVQPLIGQHDFISFIKPRLKQTTIRDLHFFQFEYNKKTSLIEATIKANAFAHNMVRCLVGACLLIGKGKRQPHWLLESLLAKKRKASLGPAPAKGLFLHAVEY
jgi:tRNA pseudouridine38-40 synthase